MTIPRKPVTAKKDAAAPKTPKKRAVQRKRGRKPYPVMTFEEVLPLAAAVMEIAAGHPAKRLTLLEKMSLEPNAQATRNLITNSSKYGLTEGHHHAEEIKLTDTGKLAVAGEASPQQRIQARFDLAVKGITEFNQLYERFKGSKLPAREVMRDTLEHLDAGDRSQCVDIFIGNAKTVGLLAVKAGAEQLLTIDQLLESVPTTGDAVAAHPTASLGEPLPTKEDFSQVCFVIAPIGNEGEEQRKHSDMILSAFVEHAVEEYKLRVIRADKISKPGMISAQVIEYVLNSALVVADLSFHNPNVFYELSLRHVTGKPTVHLIRDEDKIPFDTGNFRTVRIRMDDKYALVAQLETYRAEISNQVRQVMANGFSRDNPILAFAPGLRMVFEEKPAAAAA